MSFYDNVPLENLVVLITRRGARFGQMARVVRAQRDRKRTTREVEYADGSREILSGGFDLFVRYCNGQTETKECVKCGRDLNSLRKAFNNLNNANSQGNYEFCVAYGALFYTFQNRSEHDRK